MINWATVAPAIKDLVGSLALETAVSPPFKARWSNKTAPFIHQEAKADLMLRLRSVSSDDDGEDQIIWVDNGSELIETIVGTRQFVVEVRVESLKHDDGFSGWAWSMAGRIATRINRQRSRDTLKAASTALIEISPIIDISYDTEDRRIDAASFELTFRSTFCDADQVSFDWFERISLTSHLETSAEQELPEPPNYTNSLMPPIP